MMIITINHNIRMDLETFCIVVLGNLNDYKTSTWLSKTRHWKSTCIVLNHGESQYSTLVNESGIHYLGSLFRNGTHHIILFNFET